jgi:microcystin-dependent protein
MTSHLGRRLLGAAAASLALLAAAPAAQAGTEPYLGEIMVTIDDICPKGWAKADGRLMPISQNSALFAVLGSKFGGDAVTTFALPDMRGRTVVGTLQNMSEDPPIGPLVVGAKGGAEASTIDTSQTPIRTVLGRSFPNGTIAPAETRAAAPIKTMPPWIGLTACIATTGLFPTRP